MRLGFVFDTHYVPEPVIVAAAQDPSIEGPQALRSQPLEEPQGMLLWDLD